MKPLRCATSYAVFSSWCKAYTENLIPATLFEYGVHERIIEKTTSSEVHLFRNSSNKTLFAVKRFPPNPFTIQNAQYVAQIYTEFEIGQLLRGHNQIIDIQGLVEVDGSWYQAMEYVPQSLYDLIHEIKGHVSTDNANCVLRQILEGVSYLHSQGIAHLELKLPNIIVDRDLQVKVIDFGTAMRYRGVDGEISSWVSGMFQQMSRPKSMLILRRATWNDSIPTTGILLCSSVRSSLGRCLGYRVTVLPNSQAVPAMERSE